MNEILYKIILGLFVINLIGYFLIAIVGVGLNLPATNILASLANETNEQAYNITATTQCTVSGANCLLSTTGISTNGTFGIIGVIAIGLFDFINFIVFIFVFVINVILFLITSLALILYFFFFFIPALEGALNVGIFSFIFALADVLLSIIISAYVIEYVVTLLSPILARI
jgi:hypothetical protein